MQTGAAPWQVFGVGYLVLGICCLVFGSRYFLFDFWFLVHEKPALNYLNPVSGAGDCEGLGHPHEEDPIGACDCHSNWSGRAGA